MQTFNLDELTPEEVQLLPRSTLQQLAKQCGIKVELANPHNGPAIFVREKLAVCAWNSCLCSPVAGLGLQDR